MKYFISSLELNEQLKSNNKIIVADCRGQLDDFEAGFKKYKQNHIENAIFFHGENQLTGDKNKVNGGRHPLPNLNDFRKLAEEKGINSNSIVVAHGLYSGRLLFLLKLIGIKNVKILTGGFNKWIEHKLPTTNNVTTLNYGKITTDLDKSILISMIDVKNLINNNSFLLIDSRSPQRYRGEIEPIDKIAGHIPTAINHFWKDSFIEDSMLDIKDTASLKSLWKDIIELKQNKKIVLYCGSGVTATFNFFVLLELGIEAVIYSGSYSDWISYEDNKIIVK